MGASVHEIRIKEIRTRAMAYLNRHAIIGLCSKITSTGGYTIQPPLCRFRNSMKQRYILSIFFLLLAISSSAQRTKIFGLVKDDDGQPLELANVRILGTSILTSTNLRVNIRSIVLRATPQQSCIHRQVMKRGSVCCAIRAIPFGWISYCRHTEIRSTRLQSQVRQSKRQQSNVLN